MRRKLGRPMGRLLGGLALAALLSAGAARAETLADALAYGYEASGLLEQNRALLRAADEDVATAISALRPIINWTADIQGSYPSSTLSEPTYSIGSIPLGATLGLSASLTIADGGLSRLAVDAQQEIVLATRQSLLDVEQQVLLRIVQAYQEVRRSAAFVTLRQNNVRLITQELRAAQERFDVGEVTRTDVALAEAALAAARSGLAAEEGGLVQAIEEFRAAVGRAPDNLTEAEPATVRQSIPEAKAIAQRTHPAILQAQHDVAAAEINIARAEAAMRPTVTLSGDLVLDEDLRESSVATLRASGPFYQGGRIASQIRQVMARRDASRSNLLVTAQRIDQNVGNAYASIEVARASREATIQQVRASEVAFNGVREEATLGARTTLDVLDAEQDLLDARANLVSAGLDETVATYSLLSAMGLLTAQNLGLNVRIYDPTAYYDLVDDAPSVTSDQGRALDRVLESIGD